ncbi:AIPR family protein, partial [Clostridioides difficile]|uniref:AIPR family protein n=1 Tax=Clostridioides difficile TaxID=1496 RepID=UPI0029C3A10F
MSKTTIISHPVIKSYIDNFIAEHEISKSKAKDQHTIFEQYINDLVLSIYSNDPSVTYQDMDTDTAFGIDGIAIFVSDRVVTSIEDVNSIIDEIRKFEVSFFFTQSKTSDKFNRQDISDFFTGVRRFFNFDRCEIPELYTHWEVAKYIYSKGARFKKQPSLNMKFICLSPKEIDLGNIHMKSEIDLGIADLNDMSLFNEVKTPEFLGIKDIMSLHEKNTSGLEVSITLTKQPVPYPKDIHNRIKNGYYGLIKLEEFISLLTDEVNNERILRKGIFNDNIRYYLGSSEKVEVNASMKKRLLGDENYLFGLLNNGVTIIADNILLISEDLTLTNYQIINDCPTRNVNYDCFTYIDNQTNDTYIT